MSGRITDESIDAAIREWMSSDDRSADGFRTRMRAALSAALQEQASLPVEDGWMPIGFVEFNYARKLSFGRVTTLYAEQAQSTDVVVYVDASPAQGGR